ncbi:baculoviral IAP repeat-containing protein 7 [Ctenodactylus gundi]
MLHEQRRKGPERQPARALPRGRACQPARAAPGPAANSAGVAGRGGGCWAREQGVSGGQQAQVDVLTRCRHQWRRRWKQYCATSARGAGRERRTHLLVAASSAAAVKSSFNFPALFELSYQAASDGAGQDHHRLPHLCGRVLHWDCVDGQILSQLHPLSEEEEEEGEEATSPAEPAFPGMDSEELRLASFYNWPPTSGVQPEPLAAAGFFHTGQEDKVRCFFCCGGLQSWEHGDDPWTEHAKWFPRCQFLLQSKGRSFVHSVQEAYSPQLSSWEQWEEPEEAAPASHSAGDLQEQLRRLQEERTCKVCLDHSVSVVFVPCGHLVCAECAPSLQLCPICRAPIRSWVRTFLS